MSRNIVLTFALLYAACIALICSVFVAINIRKKKKEQAAVVEEDIKNN